jgi:diadenosine tetraphosphatase ApaH/serine/threonine PP2A family protein phosphatase
LKYAVLADVHANLEALTAVLGALERLKPDRVLYLGDLVGYGADATACVSCLRVSDARAIAGNHDRYATGVTAMPDRVSPGARAAIEHAKRTLAPDQLAWLRALPRQVATGDGLMLVHGSPRNEDEYLLTWEAIQENLLYLRMNAQDIHVCFFGHTHIPAMATGARLEARFEGGTDLAVFQLADWKTYLINPGSVGQPRDGNPKAAFAVYDSTEDVVEFRRVAYDVAGAQRKIREAGLEERLATRLESGR